MDGKEEHPKTPARKEILAETLSSGRPDAVLQVARRPLK
jgi:hypothetical protein